MSRDPHLCLEDILGACRKVRRYLEGISYEAFLDDERTFDAVVRNLEVIGEASRHLPDTTLAEIPDQPWSDIRSMRNVLAHAYFAVDPDLVWSAATTKLEPLERDVGVYLASHDDGPT